MSDEVSRREILRDVQRSYGMSPRGDSKLSDIYVRGETDMSAERVARELVATDLLHKRTLYGEIIEDYMRCVALNAKEEHPTLTWDQVWSIVRKYAPNALKLMMCSSCSFKVPQLCKHSES